jgi:glycerophosphoryl diester phosphodiesterase
VKGPWAYPRIFAHRGGGSLAPENTLAAIRIGQERGFGAHEFDVKLSRDDVALLLHDDTLERTTNGSGRAADFAWSDLAKLDAGAWHSAAFRGEPLASFEGAAKLLRSKGTLANVEIKPTKGCERETGEQVGARAKELWEGASVPPLLSSFSFEALMAAKESAPALPRGWLTDEFTPPDWAKLAVLDAVSLHTNHRKLPKNAISRLHDKGYRILLYTVNDAAVAEKLLNEGVDGIFTDNLREFAQRFPEAIRAP